MSPKNVYIKKIKTLFLANFFLDIYNNIALVLVFVSFLWQFIWKLLYFWNIYFIEKFAN